MMSFFKRNKPKREVRPIRNEPVSPRGIVAEVAYKPPKKKPQLDLSSNFEMHVQESAGAFFVRYPFRSSAMVGAIFGLGAGAYLVAQYSLTLLMASLVLVASTLSGALLMVAMTAASIFLSTMCLEMRENRFGAETPTYAFDLEARLRAPS